MNELARRIEAEAVHLGGGMVKVDGVLNHRIDPALMAAAGRELAGRLQAGTDAPIDKVLTAETSGIVPAFATALALGVPCLFARKRRPVTMADPVLTAEAPSPTKGGTAHLHVAAEYLRQNERVVLVDDFLASGSTLCALATIVRAAGARVVGAGCFVEKEWSERAPGLEAIGVPVLSLARLRLEGDRLRVD
ncbi:MAG: xanthine phosphoribosyltransferase [Ectothiorhodospiraceae bacterium]|nr:xanthine phosphoribosyltransferase [Chromatiales bacterium]MCP5154500.1 xanthine phosphoribosyltransferase [Ectothiorhodospiraceae bacterium]